MNLFAGKFKILFNKSIKGSEGEKGFAALFIAVIVLAIIFALAMPLILLVLGQQRIVNNLTRSTQAYFAAEAGIEDALIRIKNRLNFFSFYTFEAGDITAEVEISDIIGGSRTVTSAGNFGNRIRKVRVNYAISGQEVSFFYGAHAGQGGVEMKNNSKIIGNVFSNGSIINTQPQGGEITDSAIAAGDRIGKVEIGGDAKLYNCYNASIQGNLSYVSGATISNCDVDGISAEIEAFGPEDFAISDEMVEGWKIEGEQGDVIPGNYDININQTVFLGPAHIQGNLTLRNNSTLRMQGTILVSGNLIIQNNAVLELDEGYYYSRSGVLVVEGRIDLQSGGIIKGSGDPASYLMVISLNNSLTDAIKINNTADGGVFFAPNGAIALQQNIKIREATAYKIILEQNAVIEYETGLENTFFSSGAGGGWKAVSWREIE